MANNTPSYHQVASQPADSGGWLGRFGNFFGGGGTPGYLGDGQPSAGSGGGILSVATPAYRPAPVTKPENASNESVSTEPKAPIEQTSTEHAVMAQAVYACPLDSDPFGSGPIAIVIPRQG